MINKYFFVKGGSERYAFELTALLEKYGHEVIPFAMNDPQNISTPFSKYFVEHVDYSFQSPFQKVINAPKLFGKMVYSLHSQNQLKQLLREYKPDLAHLHMIDHQISPSILPVLHKQKIPIVQTVHQYKLICPNYRLYVPEKKEICERCLTGRYWNAVGQKCHKNSRIASAMVAIETMVHRKIKIYEKYIDRFIAPSKFLAEKLIASGIPASKIEVVPHFVHVNDFSYQNNSQNYYIFYGRLSEEKGLFTLLKAARNIPEVELKIVGDGPLLPDLIEFVRQNRIKHVSFEGKKLADELFKLVADSLFVVLPSEWYENAPMVIYEANAMGKPVLGADIGGISEHIRDGIDGTLFPAGNLKALTEKIQQLIRDRNKLREMGKRAREKAEKYWNPDIHYQRLKKIYQEVGAAVV